MKINQYKVVLRPKRGDINISLLKKPLFIFYFFFCFQFISFSGFSQNKITLEEKNSELKDIISKIESQTSYRFILNNDIIDVTQKFSISVLRKDILEIIDLLFKDSSISYKIKKKFIILSKKIKPNDEYTVSGLVTDAETGETLIGASLFIKKSNKVIITNNYGFYSITLPDNEYVFEVSYVGYITQEIKIQLNKNINIKVELLPSIFELKELVLSSYKNTNSQVKSVIGGITNLTAKKIKETPAFLGEPDLTRVILTQPGISSVGEGTSGYNARGGNVDQNLILLDEAPLYNTSHLFGFFSIFNADAVKDVKLYKGGIPARYGGRASSVLDIRQKNGNLKKIEGEGGIGLLFSRFTLQGPILKDKVSFLLSGRRSYFDLFFPLDKDIPAEKFHFYDLNTKLSWNINEKNSLYISGFFAADVIKIDQNDVGIDLGWTNATTTLRWNHVFSNKLFANTTGVYSDYKFGIGLIEDEESEDENFEITLNRSIQNYILKYDLTYYSDLNTKMRFGLYGNMYHFIPKISQQKINLLIDKEEALELASYFSIEKKWDKLSLNAGARFSWFANYGKATIALYEENFPQTPITSTGTKEYKKNEISKSYFGIEPRLSLKYDFSKRKAFKIGYNRMFQYVHLITNQTVALPNDIWKPSGKYIEPLEVNQFSVGYAYDTKRQDYNFSLEGYYKTFDNIVEYKNGARLGVVDNIETELVPAKGFSYGLEFSAHKNKGKLTGNINYTYSVTQRKTKSEFSSEQINSNDYFSSDYDRPHLFNLTANYKWSKKWETGLFFTYQTGRPTTQPNGRFVFNDEPYLTYSNRNDFRLPDTHRADVSFTYTPEKNSTKRWEKSWSFGLYNVYSHKNAFSINSFLKDSKLETKELSLIGAPIPFISYNFKF